MDRHLAHAEATMAAMEAEMATVMLAAMNRHKVAVAVDIQTDVVVSPTIVVLHSGHPGMITVNR